MRRSNDTWEGWYDERTMLEDDVLDSWRRTHNNSCGTETWQHHDGGVYVCLKWQDLAALYVYYNGSASRRRALQREFMTIRGMVGRILRSVMTIGRMVGRMEWSFDQQGMVGRTRRELMSIDIDGVVTMEGFTICTGGVRMMTCTGGVQVHT